MHEDVQYETGNKQPNPKESDQIIKQCYSYNWKELHCSKAFYCSFKN